MVEISAMRFVISFCQIGMGDSEYLAAFTMLLLPVAYEVFIMIIFTYVYTCVLL